MHEQWITAATLSIGAIACVTDVRSRRIPNVLTLGAAAAALAYHTAANGAVGAASAGAGWIVGTLLFLPFFLLRGMGAGDVKLLAAIGAWLGPRDAMWLAIYSSLAGGAIGICVALSHGYLATAMRNIVGMVRFWAVAGFQPVPSVSLECAETPRLAYAIPIFVGTVATLWVQ